MGTIWGWMKLILQLWEALKVFLGLVERVKHESDQKEIKDQTDIVMNPETLDQERLDAIEELEKITNRHAKP